MTLLLLATLIANYHSHVYGAILLVVPMVDALENQLRRPRRARAHRGGAVVPAFLAAANNQVRANHLLTVLLIALFAVLLVEFRISSQPSGRGWHAGGLERGVARVARDVTAVAAAGRCAEVADAGAFALPCKPRLPVLRAWIPELIAPARVAGARVEQLAIAILRPIQAGTARIAHEHHIVVHADAYGSRRRPIGSIVGPDAMPASFQASRLSCTLTLAALEMSMPGQSMGVPHDVASDVRVGRDLVEHAGPLIVMRAVVGNGDGGTTNVTPQARPLVVPDLVVVEREIGMPDQLDAARCPDRGRSRRWRCHGCGYLRPPCSRHPSR